MNCVNKSSKEFKSLASRNNVSDNALELIVHKYWREKGNENYFPSDSYVQAQLGAIPYEETGKSVKKLWNKKYSSPQSYDTFEKLQSAIVEAQRYFPNEAIVHYQNADGKFVLAIRQPVRSFYKALDEAEAKGSFEAPVIPLEVEEGKEYTLETAQNLFDKFNADRTAIPLADKVFKLADTIGIKVVFSNGLKDGNIGAFGHNTIILNKDFYENSNSNDKKAATILHELIHAITTYAISDKVNAESLSKPLQEFRKDIHQLFTELQYNPALKGERGILNEREFIAELSNPIFRKKIQAIDNNRKESFWQRIVNAIKNLLGIHSSSPYYTRMMNTLDKAINAFDVKTYMEYNGLTNALKQGTNDDLDYNNFIKNQKELDDIKAKAIKDGIFMKAPNGKPTNLNEQQWLQVRTKAFKDWFGDWENDPKNASKVVDENGEPLVVYHGTTTPNITKFDLAKTRSGGAFWFANKEAQKVVFYTGQDSKDIIMMPLFINMRTPLLNNEESMEPAANDETHDGGLIIGKLKDFKEMFSDTEYKEALDKGLNANSYLATGNVANPNQLKSAVYNNGDFSTTDDNIDYNTLSTEDIKKEIHGYVNNLPEGAVKSKEALHSFINGLTENDIKNIYNDIEQNRNDVNLVIGKLRQLARDKKPKGNQKYFTFKDGKSVKAPFVPNDQQVEALNKINDFLHSNKNVMTLSGYAGTGKTSIMEMIAEKAKIDGMQIVFTATTNKATQVLKAKVGYIGYPVMTANKAFGIALEPGDKKEYDARDLKAVLVESKVAGCDAAIIDEASMLNQENFDILTSIAEEVGLKIIFTGDVAQLPPVERNNNSVKLSPVFTNKQGNVITLTKVERTGDNAILKEATNLRDGEKLSGVSSFNKDGKGVAYIKPSSQEERNKIIKAFAPKMKDDPDYFRILTYSNKSVAQYNDIVRKLLGYSDNNPRVGETILGYSNYDYNKQTRQYGFINSVSYKVVSVAPPKVNKVFVEGKAISLNVIPVTIEGMDGDIHTYDMVDIKGNDANKKAVTEISKTLSNLWAQWKVAQTKSQSSAILKNINYLEKSLFVNDDIFNERGYKLLNKRYDFGYAMTIHKSQGSTFKNVLLDDVNVAMYNNYLDREALKKAEAKVHHSVDASSVDTTDSGIAAAHSNVDNAELESSIEVDIFGDSNTQDNNSQTNTTQDSTSDMVDIRRQLEYVGVSRASDTVTIISNNVKKEGSPLHPEEAQTSTASANYQPITSSNKITPVRRGRMSYSYGSEKLSGVKADTTFDAIINGERTATTRYSKDGHIDYWEGLKAGDVVEFTDGKGRSLYVEITIPLHKLDKNTTAEEWCKKEGWSKERFNNKVKPQIDKGEAYQMEFRYIGTPNAINSNHENKEAINNTALPTKNNNPSTETDNSDNTMPEIGTGAESLLKVDKDSPMANLAMDINPNTINPVQKVLSDKTVDMQTTLSLPNFEHFVYDRAADKLKGIKVDAPWKKPYLEELDSQFRRMEDEDEEKYHMSDADKQYNQTLIDKMKVILNAKDKDDYLNDKQRDYKEKLQSALSDYDKLNQQYANLLNGMTDKDGAKWCDSPFTVSEIRHVAELIMDSISDTITDLQTQDGLAEKLFPNVKPEESFDFKKASREDIIDTIGIENLFANAKKTFDTEHNNWFEDNCDENYDDAYNKANFIYNNWDAIVKMGADVFAFNEGIGISRDYGEHKFNTTKETQPLTDDFNNDLDEDSLNEQEGDAQEHWQVNFRTIDTMNSMSALIRQAIHECYDLDENGQPKVHPLFGLKERVDERKVTNNILNWVQGARTIDEMVDKLSAQQKNNRWLSQLITRLQDKSGANADFQSQFFGVFCKHFQLYSIVIDQNGKYTCINANAHPALTEIMNGIKGKYHLGEHPLFTSEGKVNRRLLGNDKTVDDSNPFNLKQAFKHLPEWDFGGNHKEIDMSPEKMEEYAEWLTKVTKALGYDVNQELIADILNEKSLATMVEKLHFIVQDLEGAVKMENNGEKYDPFKYKGNHNINSAIQNFMSPIAAVLENSVTNSFFDSGKMYQSFVIPSFTTKLFQNLTQTSDEEFNKFMMEEYGKSEWFRGKEVFNRQTKKMEVQWNVPWLKWMKANRKSLSHRVQLNFNGHNYMKNLTDQEYALSVLAEYNSEADNTAWFRIPMESNKPSEEFIRFLAYKDKNNYKSQIVEDLSDMVFMEISRIQTVLRRNLSKDDKGFIKNFDTNGRKFCFFPFLNDYITEDGKGTILKDAEGNVSKDNKVLAELLQKKIKGEEELTADEEVQLRKLIKDTTAAYMQKRADNILNMMKQKGIVRASYKIKNMVDEKYIKPKDATGKPLEGEELEKYYDNVTDKVAEQAIENFLWNDYLASKNILMIMVGDTAFYKDAEDLQKRLAELHAPGIRGNINAIDYEGKKVSADGKYRTVILKDFDSFKSNIIANLNEVFDRKIAQAPEHEKAAWKALKEDILKAYSEVNVADAEGYSSMTSYRKKALMFGKWSKNAEEIYKKILAGNYTYTELKTAFQPMKPFVYTHLEKNMGVENAPIHMMYSPFQAKNSEVLLVMADALLRNENTSRPNILRAIDNIMEDSAYDGRERDITTGKIIRQGTYNGKGIDTIQFESAIKSSLQGAIDLNSFLNDKNGGESAAYAYLKSHIYKEGTNEYDVDNYVHEASFADYCIQQEIPEHFRNHSQTHGSQTRMITPSDLDEYYDYNKDHNDPDNIVKYEWTDDNGVKHSLTAEELRSNYESTISDNIYDSLDKLSHEFHLTDSEGNPITDIKERNIALSQILVKEIDSSPRYGVDLRWACSLDENGEFNIPLGDPIQCKRIEQLINSIIKNRVNKQEIPGGPIVQVSNFGTSRQLHIRFNDKNGNLMPTEEEYNKAKEGGTLTDEQKKYSSYKDYIHENQGGIAYFEVFAPIWSDEIAEKFMDENGNIDIKAIEETNPEMLKLITYRIPTEDKYSMAPCKIVGFMPREVGDTIMLPYELTTIDGSDFDIDKRYVMRKDYRIIENRKKIEKELYKRAEKFIAEKKGTALTYNDKKTLNDKVGIFLDTIGRPDADKLLTGNFDKELKRLYQEIHDDKELMKHMYTTAPVDKNSKQFNDNEIVNMSWAVLTNPTSADKILNPGGFELQKKVGYMVAAYKNPANADVSWNSLHAMKVGELKDLSYTQKDLAWFDTQMQFYKQNSAAATLIGIFAVNKIAHAVLEANDFYIDIPEICGSGFAIGDTEFKDRMKVDPRYDTNGSIIGKVLGSLVGASADAVKDPVLNLMNINITTAGMLNTMVRLGVPFEDAALFLSQDLITKVIDEFNKRNLSNFVSIDDVVKDFKNDIEERTGLAEDGAISKEGITKEELVDGLREGNHDKADYKVLLAFTKLKALTDKMRNITFATRFNSISSAVGPLIVDNLIMEHKIHNFLTRRNDNLEFIKPQDEITVPHEDGSETTEQAPTGFYTKDGKVVDINDVWEAHPILEAFKDTVKIAYQVFEAANMPTNSVKFRTIIATLEKYGLTEKVFSDKKLLDQLSTFYQSYMLMASGLIDSKNLNYYINDFPKKFLEYQKNDKYSGNALIQAIKLNYSRQTNKPFLQIKITGMDAKEKEELSSAWVDLYKQDQKLATALFQYSFFRAGIGFSPKTFMALVPVYIKNHLAKTANGETITYKDVYKGKYNDQIVDDNVIDQFVRNNWDNNKLVPWVNPKKNHLSISYNSKTMTAYDKEGHSALAGKMYVKTSSKGTTYLWKKRGVLFDPEEKALIYDMVAPLGNNGEYLEISTNEINKALTDTNKPAEKDNQADLDIESSTTTDNSALSSTTVDTKAEEKKEEKNSISLREMFINFNPTLANDHRAENLIESYKKNTDKYVGILQKIFKANGFDLNTEETIKKFKEKC